MGRLFNTFLSATGIDHYQGQKMESKRLDKARKRITDARKIKKDLAKTGTNVTLPAGSREKRILDAAEAVKLRARRRAKKGKKF